MLAVVFGLLGVVAGAVLNSMLSTRRERTARRNAFITRQLQDLYSPLLGLRAEIRARSELRVRLREAGDGAWRDLVKQVEEMHPSDPEARRRELDARKPEFEKLVTWDNTVFRERLLPAYQEMITVFRKNLWLAEPETRSFLPTLVEYVDVWERHLAGSIPGEVIEAIGHG